MLFIDLLVLWARHTHVFLTQNGAANGHGNGNDDGKGKEPDYDDGESDDGE